MTSRIRTLFVLAILFTVFVKPVFAAGQACCDSGYQYSSGHCIQVGGGGVKKTNCNYGEKCLTTNNGGNVYGVCSTSSTTNDCCSVGKYDTTKKMCVLMTNGGYLDQPGAYKCTKGEKCVNNYCVTGYDSTVPVFNVCANLSEPQKGKCADCLGDNDENSGVWTALGCIHGEPVTFVKEFIRIAIGIAGGIALLLLINGAFMLSTSMGDPKKADEAKDLITSTIAGLLFIIFSVIILNFIGVQILTIPGF